MAGYETKTRSPIRPFAAYTKNAVLARRDPSLRSRDPIPSTPSRYSDSLPPTGSGSSQRYIPAMRILIIGGGGREHALAWKLTQEEPGLELIAAPGNPGIAE